MEKNYTAPGPIFEPGPGWGGRLKKWSKKYILGGDCVLCRATRYVLVFGIIFLIVISPKLNPVKKLDLDQTKIVETVQPGDGKTNLARRMLAKYLDQNLTIKPTNAQRVFIETVLREKIPNDSLNKIGSQIEMYPGEIEKAIGQSGLLTPLQIKKWETYSQGISF